jgi:hypothetical protein
MGFSKIRSIAKIHRNKVYIRWKWTVKSFTLPISTLDTKSSVNQSAC